MNGIQKPLNRPIITGRPEQTNPVKSKPSPAAQGSSFQELFQQTLETTRTTTQELTLSKHAQTRTQQRGISLDETQLERLGQAVGLAEDKGLKDTLIMMDNTAFIVNVPNRVIVTVVDGNQENTVFTNIDGAVIV